MVGQIHNYPKQSSFFSEQLFFRPISSTRERRGRSMAAAITCLSPRFAVSGEQEKLLVRCTRLTKASKKPVVKQAGRSVGSKCLRIKMGTRSGEIVTDAEMDSSDHIPLPVKRILVGCGGLSVDYLASVASFPNPDDKIRTVDFQVQGGGNVGNALTAAARLGLAPKVVSKVADDGPGKQILQGLQTEGIDTSHIVIVEGGNSPFTYIIVDKQQSTRTCIHTPISSTFVSGDLSPASVRSALTQADLVYFDGRFSDAALVIANEAARLGVPILLDAENWKREGLNELLLFADYVVCSAKFPQGWTGADNLAEALLLMALKLPKLRFLIVTLGASGCAMLERASTENPDVAVDFDMIQLLESLRQECKEKNTGQPFVVSSKVGNLRAAAAGEEKVLGRLVLGTAENIPSAEIVDTTGAGDAFIGAVMYSLCADYPVEKMLPLAAVVAAGCCRALGARPGLPHRLDSKILALL